MFRDLIRKLVSKTAKVVTLPTARTSGEEFLLKKTDYGIVHVDFAVIQQFAERAVSKVRGVRETTISVEGLASTVTPLKIRLTLTLEEGYSAPRASENADRAINNALKNSLGLEFLVPVSVKVRQIEPFVTTKKRRVR